MTDDNVPAGAVEVVLNTEPVELYKILKFEALASSGAEAKLIIDEGLVLVNGEPELRRRRKIMSQDVVEFDGVVLKMTLPADGYDAE